MLAPFLLGPRECFARLVAGLAVDAGVGVACAEVFDVDAIGATTFEPPPNPTLLVGPCAVIDGTPVVDWLGIDGTSGEDAFSPEKVGGAIEGGGVNSGWVACMPDMLGGAIKDVG